MPVESRPAQRYLPVRDTLVLPQVGVTYVHGGSGTVVISMNEGALLGVRWVEEDGGYTTKVIPVLGCHRTEGGISFIDVYREQHVFGFGDRPVDVPPAWESAFPAPRNSYNVNILGD